MDWGLGHIAHFYEFMILRLLAPGSEPVLPGHDVHALFDSFRPRTTTGGNRRGCRERPTLGEIVDTSLDVTDRLVNLVGPDDDTRLDPVSTICTSTASCTSTGTSRISSRRATPSVPPSPTRYLLLARPRWQTCGAIPSNHPPLPTSTRIGGRAAGAHSGFVSIPAGKYLLGATKDEPWVFGQRWAHEIDVPAFRIAKSATTNAEFAAFIAAGGPQTGAVVARGVEVAVEEQVGAEEQRDERRGRGESRSQLGGAAILGPQSR